MFLAKKLVRPPMIPKEVPAVRNATKGIGCNGITVNRAQQKTTSNRNARKEMVVLDVQMDTKDTPLQNVKYSQ